MLKKTITFEDLEGNERTEDFYFNMTKQELAEFHLKTGGFDKILEGLRTAENMVEAYNIFKDVVLMSYGVRSEDGVSFIKHDANGQPLSKKFADHPASGELILELLENGDRAQQFIEGLFPQKHRAAIRAAIEEAERDQREEQRTGPKPVTDVELPAAPPVLEEKGEPKKTYEDYSRQELLEMSREEFDSLLPKGPGQMTQDMLQVAMQRRSEGK
jgi:hypothetical protein